MPDFHPMNTAPKGEAVLLKSTTAGVVEALFTSPYEHLTFPEMQAHEDFGAAKWMAVRQEDETPVEVTDPQGWAPRY